MMTVAFPIKPQMKRPEVADLHAALGALGFSIGPAEAGSRRFGASTRAAVMAFQKSRRLPTTGAVDQATAEAINAALAGTPSVDASGSGERPAGEPPADEAVFRVEGEVVRPDGTPLQDYLVRAYDRAICAWRPLGDSRTNDYGRYEIAYDSAQLEEWGKSRADLRVEVLPPSGPDPSTGKVLARSALILQALPRETVSFSIGTAAYRGPDEFTRVQRALAPELQSVQSWTCLETGDVLIAARGAALRPSLVAYYVKARVWADRYDLPAAVFYAWMRRGESTRIDALVASPLRHLWASLGEARAGNVIGLALDQELRARVAAFQQRFLAQPAHPYARLLATTALDAGKRSAFTARLTTGEFSGDAFWRALEADETFTSGEVAELRGVFEVQALVDDNTSVSLRLRTNLGAQSPRDVARLSLEDWRTRVVNDASVEVPDEVLPAGSPPERREMYARMLCAAAEHACPTASLAAQMARSPDWSASSLPAFFAAHAELELRDTRVLAFLRATPDALAGVPDPKGVRDDLLRIEQLFHLTSSTNRLDAIQPLWQAGLRSAPQIAYLGRDALGRRTASAIRPAEADRIHRAAVHVTAMALNVYLHYHPRLNALSLPALQLPQAPGDRTSTPARPGISMPEWEELFGSADACDCCSCESALGPAAYLVDTMAFLQRAVDAGGHDALDELLVRRPDLGSLELTCDNADVELPQIDLVIEILEAIVASADGKTLPSAAIGSTTWDSALLAAQPEHLEPAAYEVLRSALYPIELLPFDLWAEEGRQYLGRMGLARDELMRVMPPRTGVRELEIATETLRMSSLERDVIVTPTQKPTDVAARWGVVLTDGTLVAKLRPLERLIDQAHIDYDRLLRLLNTRFLNPGRTIAVSFPGSPCSLDSAVLAGDDGQELPAAAFRDFLDRLHRFLRLQRRLDCTEYDLDELLTALGTRDFVHPAFIPQLADVQTLRAALGIGLPELGAWWAERLDTYAFDDETPSQYEAIFLNEAVVPDTYPGTGPDLRNEVFGLTPNRTDLAITSSTDAALSCWLAESDGEAIPTFTLQSDYAAYIQSATGLTAEDLQRLVDAELLLARDDSTGHVPLTLANVSSLYRTGSLARAFHLSASDVLRLGAITGLSPVRTATAAPRPPESRRFCDLVHDITTGPASIEELAYLLLHDADATAALAPRSEDVDAWFAATGPGLAGIVLPDDPRVTDDLKASNRAIARLGPGTRSRRGHRPALRGAAGARRQSPGAPHRRGQP